MNKNILKQPHLKSRRPSTFNGISILSCDTNWYVEGYESDMTQKACWKSTNLPGENGYPCYYHPKSPLVICSYMCYDLDNYRYDERYYCSNCNTLTSYRSIKTCYGFEWTR